MPENNAADPAALTQRALAEARKFEAEALSLEAYARKSAAEATTAEFESKVKNIQLEREIYKRSKELVSDEYSRVYRFTDSVGAGSVAGCMAQLATWSRLDGENKNPIEIVFTSPGGSVLHGFALFDYIRVLSRQGHFITTTDLGYSASMAGILLQAGDIRQMGKESYFHIHEISAGAIGKLSEMEDATDFYKKITDRVVKIFVERSGGKITATRLKKMFVRKEAWFSSDEALKYGLVDQVI